VLIQGGRLLEIDQPDQRQELISKEKPPETLRVSLVASSGEELHDDHLCARQ
jgi:hypothetical protein